MSIQAITPYIPQRILEKLISDDKKKFQRAEKLTGAVLFIDMAKFTSLTTAIEKSITKDQDVRGGEILQELMTEYFTSVIDTIRKYAGVVYQFAGDSVLVGMEVEEGETVEHRARLAVSCAMEMQQELSKIEIKEIAGEKFALAAKVSVGFGDYYQILLGSPRYFMNSTILGKPIEEAILGESYAVGGEIFVSEKVWEMLPESKKGERVENHYKIFNADVMEVSNKKSYVIDEHTFEKNHLKLCAKFIAPVLYKKVTSGHADFVGDFREVTCLFLRFDGLNYTENASHNISLLNTFYEHVQNVSDDYGGTLIQVDLTDKGNVFLILFGAPQGLENKEIMASRMARKLFSTLGDYKFAKNVQIGVATGPVFCGDLGSKARKGYTVVGESANYASRLMNFSEQEETFLDKQTALKIKENFDVEELADIQLKGISQPQTFYRLGAEISIPTSERQFMYTEEFVGRKKELASMEESLNQAIKSQGQTLLLTGEAGVGKSRLIAAFLEKTRELNMELFSANCYSYEKNTPFFPWKEILTKVFDLDAGGDPANETEKIKAYLSNLNDINVDWAYVLARIIGFNIEETAFTANIDPRQKNDRIFQIIMETFRFKSLGKVIVIFIEDFHWTDEVSRNLAAYIADHISEDEIQLLLVGRPSEDLKPFTENKNITWVDLSELPEEDARLLLKMRLALDKDNDRIEELILSRCRGNPFFIESIVHSFREQKVVEPIDENQYRLTKEINEIEVPNTLQDVILSRIDRLDEHAQAVLKTASVIGRIFMHDLVKNLIPVGIQSNLDNHFQALIDLELTPVETTEPLTYIFKHIVIRDVAYNSMLTNTRKGLHLQLAQIMESETDEENRHETADMLAYHYLEGGDYDKGYEYNLMAARKAKEQYANNDAIKYYRNAMESLHRTGYKNIEELEFEIKEELAVTSRQAGNFDEAKDLYAECLEYYKNAVKKGRLHIGLGRLYQEQGNPIRAIKEMERALKYLGKRPPATLLTTVFSLLYQATLQLIHNFLPFFVLGATKNPEKYRLRSQALMVLQKIYIFVSVERVAWSGVAHVNLAERMKTDYDLSLAYSNYGAILQGIGLKGLSRKYFEKGLALSEKSGDPFTVGSGLQLFGLHGIFSNDMNHTITNCEKSVEMFKQMGEHWQAGTSMMITTMGYDGKGDFRSCLNFMEQMEELALEVNSQMHIGWAMARISYYNFMFGKMDPLKAIERTAKASEMSKEIQDMPGYLTALRYKMIIETYSKIYDDALATAKLLAAETFGYKVKFPHIIISLVDVAEFMTYALKNGAYEKNKRSVEKLIKRCYSRAASESKQMPFLEGPAIRARAVFIEYKEGATKARPYYEKSLAIFRNLPAKYELAKTLRAKGLAYGDQTLIDEAMEIFKTDFPKEAEITQEALAAKS